MAGARVPDVGLLEDAASIKANSLDGCDILLFTTAHTPAASDVLGTYSAIEAAWTGYARQSGGTWSTPVIDGSDRATMYSQLVVFTVTSGGTGSFVHGYAVISTSGDLHHAEELASPIAVTDGIPISLMARYSPKNC